MFPAKKEEPLFLVPNCAVLFSCGFKCLLIHVCNFQPLLSYVSPQSCLPSNYAASLGCHQGNTHSASDTKYDQDYTVYVPCAWSQRRWECTVLCMECWGLLIPVLLS